MLADVERHGWHVVLLAPSDGLPGWAFTVGLTHSFGTPELAVCGLDTKVMHTSLNILGEVAREGGELRPGDRNGDVLDGYDVYLGAVDPAWHHALFGYARWFYRPREPQFLQCVWPDMSHRFPWDDEFDRRIGRLQPPLWVAPAEAPNGPWRAWWQATRWPGRTNANGLVFVSARAAAGEVPILGVKVFEDGDWAFLDGISGAAKDMQMSHLHHILEQDPSLEETIGLSPGTIAWRDGPGRPWSVGSGEAAAAPEGD